MARYDTTIRARERQADVYADLIREAFEYHATIFISAEVEGQPNPDKDYWRVRAEVMPNIHILFKLGPTVNHQQPILAAIVYRRVRAWPEPRTELREVLDGDIEDAKVWISRAWMYLHPKDPDVIAITVKGFSFDE